MLPSHVPFLKDKSLNSKITTWILQPKLTEVLPLTPSTPLDDISLQVQKTVWAHSATPTLQQ